MVPTISYWWAHGHLAIVMFVRGWILPVWLQSPFNDTKITFLVHHDVVYASQNDKTNGQIHQVPQTSRRHQHVTRITSLSRIPCTSRNNFQREFSSKQGLYAFKVSLKIFFTLRKSQQVYNVYDKEPWHISDAHLVDHTHKWTNGSKASETNKHWPVSIGPHSSKNSERGPFSLI